MFFSVAPITVCNAVLFLVVPSATMGADEGRHRLGRLMARWYRMLAVPSRSRLRTVRLACALVAGCLLNGIAGAQELEPRAYSPAPVGMNVAAVVYGNSKGDLSFDPSVPATDVTARIQAYSLGYARTFGLAGHSASFSVALPHITGNVSGNVGEERATADRSGFGDARLRLSVNLFGGPALTPGEFAQRTPGTAVGASLSVVAPTGEYDSSKLINIGSNRWAFKPEVGITHEFGRWFLESSAGVWLFTDNNEFYGGKERQQDPLGTLQFHAGYTFRPGLWLAGNATYYAGGRTSVDGVEKQDRQGNSRYGLTLSLPIDRAWSAKLAWSEGLLTRIGGDFTTFSIALQYRWFDN
ncbi:MAG: transporter [Burkholderiales bacterium]